jgi:hypothetical protein
MFAHAGRSAAGEQTAMAGKPLKSSSSATSRGTSFILAVLVSTAWTPIALASEFPKVIPLSSLDGIIGFRLDGVAVGDLSGVSTASAGDVNGDGFDDIIIAARDADPHGENSGSSYVVFGKALSFPTVFELSSLDGTNGFRLDGEAAHDYSGYSVAGAGDVNGDGFADIIVGAPHHLYAGFPGKAYVVFGKPSGFADHIALSSLDGKTGFRLDGVAASDATGFRVRTAGDINGDGFDDIIVGADRADPHGTDSGSSYVVFGKPKEFAASIKLSSLNGGNGFRLDGVAAGDGSGYAVGGGGDIDGDGFADMIVGAWGADPHGTDSGSTYVVFGQASGFAAHINLSSLNGTNGFRIDGVAAGDHSGRAVANAGDVNGDGFADIIVKAPRGVDAIEWSYVVFGQASGFAATIDLSSLDGSNGFRLDGVNTGNFWGPSIASPGDVNSDGFTDVIIGATHAHGEVGRTYVVFGKASGFASVIDLGSLDGKTGFRLDGEAPGDDSGHSNSIGDINGDDFGDTIIGAWGADPHGSESGSSYVVFGRAPDTARTRIGSAASQYISGGAFDDTLDGREGRDELEGRGGADDLFGRADADTAFYLHAPAGVTVSLANPAINTGDAVGDSYTSIENLTGSRLNDTLIGNGKGNRIAGGLGSDLLTGGGGRDIFALTAPSESPSDSSRDRVTDFEAGDVATSVDKIDALPSTPIPMNLAISAFNSSATQRFQVSKAS